MGYTAEAAQAGKAEWLQSGLSLEEVRCARDSRPRVGARSNPPGLEIDTSNASLRRFENAFTFENMESILRGFSSFADARL